MFSAIWKQFNVTTILIVPLIDNSIIPLIYKDTPIQYPFTLAALEHGMVGGYLGVRDEHTSLPVLEHSFLYLMFNKDKVMTKLPDLTMPYFSFNELLIDSFMFDSIYDKNSDHIVYRMSIDLKWKTDIEQIISGKYSKLSKNYKEEIRIKHNRIPSTNNPIFEYLFSSNLAHFISKQDRTLNIQMGEYLHMSLPKDAELYKKFIPSNETLDISLLIELNN